MSTAYPPRLIKYALSSKKEKNAADVSAASMVSGNYGDFPNSFLLYYAGPGADFLSQRFVFRENNESLKKIYGITYFKGPGTAQMTLYSTEQHAPPTLAISSSEKRFSSSITVTAPLPPASSGNASQTIPVKYNLRRKTHAFALPTSNKSGGENSGGPEEQFEWREDSKLKPKIRRLVRSANTRTGVLEELVAIWKEGTVPNREGRLAAFEFASIEEQEKLGPYGTLIAVSSVLAICAIMGSGVDGAASWQQEKALEKNYHDGYWEEEGSHPVFHSTTTTWSDPWMKTGGDQQNH